MTIREVAHYLNLSEATVWRLVKAKKLPGFKVGGQHRFMRKMVEGMFDRQALV